MSCQGALKSEISVNQAATSGLALVELWRCLADHPGPLLPVGSGPARDPLRQKALKTRVPGQSPVRVPGQGCQIAGFHLRPDEITETLVLPLQLSLDEVVAKRIHLRRRHRRRVRQSRGGEQTGADTQQNADGFHSIRGLSFIHF